jgi:hypothetical protein
MTPQLHRADPHEFVKVPKRTLSTAFSRSASRSFSRNSSYKQRNFSYSKNFSGLSTKIMTAVSTPFSQEK